uniref:Uncharacterized protein n=1 Tax=Oryza glaberrima TaxID=4538 RepID=I1Q956_ORYGL
MAHPSPSLLFLSQIRFSPSVVVLPVLTGGENPVPFGMSIDSILDVVPLLEALLRRPTYIHNKNNDPLGNIRFQFVFASINR